MGKWKWPQGKLKIGDRDFFRDYALCINQSWSANVMDAREVHMMIKVVHCVESFSLSFWI